MTLNSRRHLLSSHWTRATRSNPLLRSPVTTLGHSQRSRVFLTTSRWPRAAAAASVVVHGRKFSPIFYLISSNSLNTLSPDRTHTQIYTYTNNFPWINIKICVHVCVYICVTRNSFVRLSSRMKEKSERIGKTMWKIRLLDPRFLKISRWNLIGEARTMTDVLCTWITTSARDRTARGDLVSRVLILFSFPPSPCLSSYCSIPSLPSHPQCCFSMG